MEGDPEASDVTGEVGVAGITDTCGNMHVVGVDGGTSVGISATLSSTCAGVKQGEGDDCCCSLPSGV